MHFGAFMEFGNRAGVDDAQALKEGFRLVDAAEERVLRSLRILTGKVLPAFK